MMVYLENEKCMVLQLDDRYLYISTLFGPYVYETYFVQNFSFIKDKLVGLSQEDKLLGVITKR